MHSVSYTYAHPHFSNTNLNSDVYNMPDQSKSLITNRSSNKHADSNLSCYVLYNFVNHRTSRNMSVCFLVTSAPHFVRVARFHDKVVFSKSFCEMSTTRRGCTKTIRDALCDIFDSTHLRAHENIFLTF